MSHLLRMRGNEAMISHVMSLHQMAPRGGRLRGGHGISRTASARQEDRRPAASLRVER